MNVVVESRISYVSVRLHGSDFMCLVGVDDVFEKSTSIDLSTQFNGKKENKNVKNTIEKVFYATIYGEKFQRTEPSRLPGN